MKTLPFDHGSSSLVRACGLSDVDIGERILRFLESDEVDPTPEDVRIVSYLIVKEAKGSPSPLLYPFKSLVGRELAGGVASRVVELVENTIIEEVVKKGVFTEYVRSLLAEIGRSIVPVVAVVIGGPNTPQEGQKLH